MAIKIKKLIFAGQNDIKVLSFISIKAFLNLAIFTDESLETNIRKLLIFTDNFRVMNSFFVQKRVHFEGLCNQDLIDELDKFEHKEEQEIDPRWSALKDINKEK